MLSYDDAIIAMLPVPPIGSQGNLQTLLHLNTPVPSGQIQSMICTETDPWQLRGQISGHINAKRAESEKGPFEVSSALEAERA
jgi:hypothetical protein